MNDDLDDVRIIGECVYCGNECWVDRRGSWDVIDALDVSYCKRLRSALNQNQRGPVASL